MTKTYRAAVIGWTGRGSFGHAVDVLFEDLVGVQLAAVADPGMTQEVKARRRAAGIACFADYRQMLREIQPEVVGVGGWVDQRRELVLACAAAGVRGIYCEKAFARTLAEADEMIRACDVAGTRLAIAHQLHALPLVEQARDAVQQGRIGRLRRMRAEAKNDARGGAEDLLVLTTHLFDLMRLFAGDPIWASGHIRREDREITRQDLTEGSEGLARMAGDNLAGYFAFRDGVAATIDSYASRGRNGLELFLEGTEGAVAIHTTRSPRAYLFKTPHVAAEPEDAGWERLGVTPTAPPWMHVAGQRIIADLLKCLERGGEPAPSGHDARWAMEMAFAVVEGQRTGGRVSFPLWNRDNPWEML